MLELDPYQLAKLLSQPRTTARATGKAYRRRHQPRRGNRDSANGLRGAFGSVLKARAARPCDPRRRHNEQRRVSHRISA